MNTIKHITFIFINGLSGSGKDTFAAALLYQIFCRMNCYAFIYKFADPIYATLEAIGIPTENMVQRSLKEKPVFNGKSVRDLMIELGTHKGWKIHGEDLWTKFCFKYFQDYINTSEYKYSDKSEYLPSFHERYNENINQSTVKSDYPISGWLPFNKEDMLLLAENTFHNSKEHLFIVVPDFRFPHEPSATVHAFAEAGIETSSYYVQLYNDSFYSSDNWVDRHNKDLFVYHTMSSKVDITSISSLRNFFISCFGDIQCLNDIKNM